MHISEDFLNECQTRVNYFLDHLLPNENTQPKRLHSALRYVALGGGKRIRATFVYAAGELVDAPKERLDKAACAIELIHAYSLVHDDLPAMDDDELRRGRPTCHIEYDEPTAILVGDALQTAAFEVLASMPKSDAYESIQMVRILAKASGSLGMVGGQMLDLTSSGRTSSLAEITQLHRLKTGALISAAVLMGTYAGQINGKHLGRITRFGENIGLAFQIKDDMLDLEGDASLIGKNTQKDTANDRPNYAQSAGIDEAKRYINQLYDEAINQLAIFGEKANRLNQVARFAVERAL